MNTDFECIRQIFLAIVEQPSAQWKALLTEACAEDTELRRQVALLLEAHAEGEGILDRDEPGKAPTGFFESTSERPGTVIGPYKLLQKIGEGGMGVVYMAEQTRPVQRKVAVKIVKAGMDSRQVLARFEAERQALALMDHPNIARVLDAGATDAGRPYFAMELVKGQSIIRYCDEHRLTPRQRLELFVQVCAAIQHAHQKGIIHRDVKPNNVLVAPYDGNPVVKVIDFGVAKATGQRLTEKTLFTEFGAVVGTLEYMSPEQAELNNQDIDTRSDIYSLGVLLYELLTGTTPLSRERLKNAAFTEMLRMIREEEPPKPSTRLSEAKDTLPSISAQRQTEPGKLTRLVRGELDWVVMKTLEKDRNRRYETASGLAADLQRYLNDEPVQACPPSASYRLRKFVRRNKGPMTAGVTIATLLVAGVAVSTWLAVAARRAEADAREAEHQAIEERDEKEKARLAEADQRRRADTARAQAVASEAATKAFSEFLVNDVLAVARPRGERGGLGIGVTVRAALDAAAAKIGERFHDRPRAEALARHDLGVTYRLIGELDKSEEQLRLAYRLRMKTLGADNEETLNTANSLAVLYQEKGQSKKAEPLLVKTLEVRRRVLGSEHPQTLLSMNNLAELYKDLGQFARAERLLGTTLEVSRRVLGEEHPNTLLIMHNLAGLYRAQSQLAKAQRLFVTTLEVSRRVLGEEHPDTLSSMNNLGGLYMTLGQLGRAEPLLHKTLAVRRRVLGPEHPGTLSVMNNLAGLYRAQGQLAKAEPLYVETLEIRRRVLGPEDPSTLSTMNNLAGLYMALKQFTKAEPLYVNTLEVRQRVLGRKNRSTLTSMNNLAVLYQEQGQLAKAEPLSVEALKIRRRVLGEENPLTLTSVNTLAELYKAMGQLAKAEPLYVKNLEVIRRVLGEDHPHTLTAVHNLAGLYQLQVQFTKAEPLYREALEKTRKGQGEKSAPVAEALATLGWILLKQQKYADAEPLLRECLKIGEQKLPDSWGKYNTTSMLGCSLLGQKKYAAAEPLLLAGYGGLKQREAKIPAGGKLRLTEALERLIQLYEATDKKDEAAKWRKCLESHQEANKVQKAPPKP